ncbi:hypothetical protein CR492_05905 [Methylocella silvestris]|uniref:Uncharacterized protein n=1 Tax=Methylocella silvestris TaxID=199596 RepID=A0A2J7TJ95_METSI|nr:hypothetical protein CR492_05905 [Methylocella silvestris]
MFKASTSFGMIAKILCVVRQPLLAGLRRELAMRAQAAQALSKTPDAPRCSIFSGFGLHGPDPAPRCSRLLILLTDFFGCGPNRRSGDRYYNPARRAIDRASQAVG